MSSPKHKEALFNEIKGSLFEYLVARELARTHGGEATFTKALPPQYLTVLAQQDRMMRELHGELAMRLPRWAKMVAQEIQKSLGDEIYQAVLLTGQLIHTDADWKEADIVLQGTTSRPVSLKLNKRASAVNTKSGGIKSFLTEYFPGTTAAGAQEDFNLHVDSAFANMHAEIHQAAGLSVTTGWQEWARNYSELPGELPDELRAVLHAFYADLSNKLGVALRDVAINEPAVFQRGLMRVVGFGLPELVQVVCFHDANGAHPEEIDVRLHTYAEAQQHVQACQWKDQREVSFSSIQLGDWQLDVRIKPMNKFTTTAIKINCAVKF